MQDNIKSLKAIHNRIKELNRKNDLLREKYKGDPKYARVHKRLIEAGRPSKMKIVIMEALQKIKEQTDLTILSRSDSLNNESYFSNQVARWVFAEFQKVPNTQLDMATTKFITQLIVDEYLNEYHGKSA